MWFEYNHKLKQYTLSEIAVKFAYKKWRIIGYIRLERIPRKEEWNHIWSLLWQWKVCGGGDDDEGDDEEEKKTAI